MLKPERMSKLFVVGPKTKLDKVISKLHDLKVAHIIEHKKDEFDLCNPLENFDKISSMLVQVRALTSHLNISTDEAKLKIFKITDLDTNLTNIKEYANKVIDQSKKIEDELALISEQKKVLKLMAYLDISPDDFKPVRIGCI